MSEWPIFVISLHDAVRRREPLVDALTRLGVTFQIFDAIDGRSGLSKTYDNQVDRERAKRRLGRVLTDAEFACALSHAGVYRLILDKRLPGAVVFEDDAIPLKGFAEFFSKQHYRDADFIQFDYGTARIWRFGFRSQRISEAVRLVATVRNSGLANAYSISSSAAAFLLDNALPISLPADWPCNLMPLAPKITVPRLCAHPNIYLDQLSHLACGREHAKSLAAGRDSSEERRNPLPKWPMWAYRLLTREVPPEVGCVKK